LDRPRRRPGLLIAAAALATLAVALGAAGPAAPPLRAMRWLAPGADAARILTRQPTECFRPPADPERAYSAELGRAAFRTPLLLGGQAARAGVACETCHRNGRTNSDFDFPGLSGAPGTADVTSSLFSSHRGDGVDNPRPIPDLGGPKSVLRISQDPASPALETFIHGLVTQEFDGAEPPPAVLKGLADYVRAMDPAACAGRGEDAVSSGATLAEARRAVRAALSALKRGDGPAAGVMVEAARSQLGLAAERFGGPTLAVDARALAASSEQLRVALDLVRAGRAGEGAQRLVTWLVDSEAVGGQLRRDEPLSLYNPARLKALAR
jgi:hypothetical protein